MSSDFLGDVFHILLHFCEHQKASPLAVLREVTQVSNVGLLVLMLSEKEKYGEFGSFFVCAVVYVLILV